MLQLPETPRYTMPQSSLAQSYELCRQATAFYSKTFYLGTLLMTEQKRRGIWAIYMWCRRTDELVDGPRAATTTPETLDAWESSLEALFDGKPTDDYDVALVDTIEQYNLDIQPFRDMIEGQRMDLYRSRYETFEELKLYCYRVAGTVGLMSAQIMGLEFFSDRLQAPWVDPYAKKDSDPIEQAIALGIANQLTNILRDVGEDARRGRIYLPQEDLRLFNYTEADLIKGIVDDRWRALMKFQIERARKFFEISEGGIRALERDARWPVWSALVLYRQILDVVERNRYDVFTKRAYVPGVRKFLSLPNAWIKAI
ncbi:MAG: phytoene synthase [Thermosynechococcaceae cyanobacterium MS004]|jgi:15-cis-phytoene synthase|nr:phytoene synthase [Thermosynechococcaceae cyanobacterium MS004]